MVPKSMYIATSEEEIDKDRSPDGPDNIYHTAYAVKDFPHEVMMEFFHCSRQQFIVKFCFRGFLFLSIFVHCAHI